MLSELDLEFKKGETVMVTGPVGAGKSALIKGLLGDLQLEGSLQGTNSVSYCSQEPWLINASVRQNIVMDEPFNQNRYDETLNLCQLREDLAVLPSGDQTELGQRGINISGGQKARVNLARAVYKESEAYLLDDVISALDAHVAQNVMEQLIFKHLKGKTVIIVTHATQYASRADRLMRVDKGRVAFEPVTEAKQAPQSTSTSIESSIESKPDKLIKEETLNKGKIPLKTYLKFVEYFKGWKVIIAVLVR